MTNEELLMLEAELDRAKAECDAINREMDQLLAEDRAATEEGPGITKPPVY